MFSLFHKKKELTIACVGDSITYGSGVAATRSRDAYPAILNRLLGPKTKVYNYGLRGRTLISTGDQPYIKERSYQQALEKKADIYILMLGTNDSKPYNWDYQKMKDELPVFVNSFKDLENHPNIFLMQPPKCFPLNNGKVPYDIQNELVSGSIHQLVADTARALEVHLIDLYSLTETHPEWFMDGVHPNREGNKMIAERVFQAISYNNPNT